MTVAAPAPVSPTRYTSIDILRGLALFGVLAVNLIGEFRVSIFQQFLPEPAALAWYDRAVSGFVSVALEMKAFALFSLLFGVGLAVQCERLSRRGRPQYWLFRRLVVLLVFGLIHLLYIWNGDILTEYAVAGLLVLPLLMAPTGVVVAAALAMLALYLALPFLPLPLGLPDANQLRAHVLAADGIYAHGGYLEVWRFSLGELGMMLPLHVWILPRTLFLFLCGVLAWRWRVVQEIGDHRRGLLVGAMLGLAAGLALSAMSAFGMLDAWGWVGAMLAGLSAIVLAGGYAAAVLVLVSSARGARVLRVFAPIGRMAFTNYVLQSLLFGWIFFGYGLGQFGKLGPAFCLMLGLAVYAAQVMLSIWWLNRYRYGPLEWLWRSLMYGRRQPMRRASDALGVAVLAKSHVES